MTIKLKLGEPIVFEDYDGTLRTARINRIVISRKDLHEYEFTAVVPNPVRPTYTDVGSLIERIKNHPDKELAKVALEGLRRIANDDATYGFAREAGLSDNQTIAKRILEGK